MFPTQELTALARYKQVIRSRIARERFECLTAMETAMRPLRWLDRLHARWQNIPTVLKFATVPVALFLKRRLFPSKARNSAFAHGFPLAWKIARAVRG